MKKRFEVEIKLGVLEDTLQEICEKIEDTEDEEERDGWAKGREGESACARGAIEKARR